MSSHHPQPHGYHYHADATGGMFPVSAFSAFHLLRNYNYLLSPHGQDIPGKVSLHPPASHGLKSPKRDQSVRSPELTPLSVDVGKSFFPPHPLLPPSLLTYHSTLPLQHSRLSPHSTQVLSPNSYLSQSLRKQRGEKKPIPDEQKDEKYFERRRRNNQAAKKSRDARKIREDQVALRATILEHENAILKAQVITLREEASSLRQMLLQKKILDSNS